MPRVFGVLVAIPILVSEVFMVPMLGVHPYVKLTAAFQTRRFVTCIAVACRAARGRQRRLALQLDVMVDSANCTRTLVPRPFAPAPMATVASYRRAISSTMASPNPLPVSG